MLDKERKKSKFILVHKNVIYLSLELYTLVVVRLIHVSLLEPLKVSAQVKFTRTVDAYCFINRCTYRLRVIIL